MREFAPQQQPCWPLCTCLSHQTPNTATFESTISFGHLSVKSCAFLSLPLYLRRHDILLPVLCGGGKKSSRRVIKNAVLTGGSAPLSHHCTVSALHVWTGASSACRPLPFLIVASLSSSVSMSALQYTPWPLPYEQPLLAFHTCRQASTHKSAKDKNTHAPRWQRFQHSGQTGSNFRRGIRGGNPRWCTKKREHRAE